MNQTTDTKDAAETPTPIPEWFIQKMNGNADIYAFRPPFDGSKEIEEKKCCVDFEAGAEWAYRLLASRQTGWIDAERVKERIAFLSKAEFDAIAELDGMAARTVEREMTWAFIREASARRHELEDLLRPLPQPPTSPI